MGKNKVSFDNTTIDSILIEMIEIIICYATNPDISNEKFKQELESLIKQGVDNILELVKGCKPEYSYLCGNMATVNPIRKGIWGECNDKWLRNLSNLVKGENNGKG